MDPLSDGVLTEPQALTQMETPTPATEIPREETGPPEKTKWWVSYGLGLIIAFTLLWGQLEAENWEGFHSLNVLGYTTLHQTLAPFDVKSEPKVTLIDISPPLIHEPKRLETLVTALVKMAPVGIGIDVDMSPTGATLSGQETAFFDAMLDLRKKRPDIPIFLGVGKRRAQAAPSAWLGIPKYQALAAGIGVPKKNRLYLPRYMTAQPETKGMRRSEEGKTGEETEYGLPAMSEALARHYFTNHGRPEISPFFRLLLDDAQEGNEGEWAYPAVLVNYSKMDEMRRECLSIEPERKRTPGEIDDQKRIEANLAPALQRIEDHIVLLGDVKTPVKEDLFTLPQGQIVPGALLHASALFTQIQEPLYEIKREVRIAIDIFLTLLGIFLVEWVRKRFFNKSPHSTGSSLGRDLVVNGLIIPAILFCVALFIARHFQVMWVDILVVWVTLIVHAFAGASLHPRVEKFLDRYPRVEKFFAGVEAVSTTPLRRVAPTVKREGGASGSTGEAQNEKKEFDNATGQ